MASCDHENTDYVSKQNAITTLRGKRVGRTGTYMCGKMRKEKTKFSSIIVENQ